MFRGSIVAIVTPFKDGQVDRDALVKMIEWHIANGTNGIVPCGTTGESSTFSHQEQADTIRLVVDTAAGRIPVLAGAGSNSTSEALQLTRAATKAGADGILTITPYYNRPPQEGLYQHFKAVREATDLPLVLYNVPARTGSNLLPETAARVAELGGIAGVKEASGNLEQIQELIDLGVPVLSGDDALTWPIMALGGIGVIGVTANFAPRLVVELCDAALAGDMATARARHSTMVALAKLAFMVTNPIPAKTAMAELGFCEATFRSPLVPLTDSQRQTLVAGLKQYKIL